jgi:MFS family permease
MLEAMGEGAEGGVVVPWPLLFRRRLHQRVRHSDRYQWWILWTVLAGLLSVNITFTVFVVALPQVARELHSSVSTLTWTSTGPLLAFGLGDLRGYRRLYLWGLSGAALSVVLTASAPTAGVLIAARLFDGVQGAATGAASMALVLQAFSHEDRVKALGWWSLVGAGGPVIGVTVGAPIIQYYGWRALFWGELPLMALAAVLAVIVLPTRDRPFHPGSGDAAPGDGEPAPEGAVGSPGRPGVNWGELDWVGSAILSGSVTLFLLALNEAPSWGWSSPRILGTLALAAVLLALFIPHERRVERPLLPLRYFKNRDFVFPLTARTLVSFAYMGGFFIFPILMESVYGYSETKAGLVSTARPLSFSLIAPVAGYAAVRVGERLSAVVGCGLLCISMLMFTRLGPQPTLVFIVVSLICSGLGNGISQPSTTSSASNQVAPDELGVMSAAQQLVTQIGVVAGIQVMVTVQASGGGGVGSLAAFHRAFAVGAVVAALAGVCGFLMRDTPREARGGRREPAADPSHP